MKHITNSDSGEPWPDDGPGPAPTAPRSRSRSNGAGESLPSGWKITEVVGSPINGATFSASFVRAIVADDEGQTHDVILRRIAAGTSGSIIWEGDIRIHSRYTAFRITPARVLKTPDWSDYLLVESINRVGVSSGEIEIAAMDLAQTKARAFWPDQLKVSLSGRVSYISEFIRASGENWERPSTLMVRGQGPIWLRNGSPIPNRLLDHSLVFITRSRVFDTNGETRDIRADLSQIPETYSYYDLTPVSEITAQEIRTGCEYFRDAYGECPNFPMIPAAFLGQLFTGHSATIKPQFFTAILQTGIKGSGKTRYAARWDAVQARNSPRTRGDDLRQVMPVLNLGDNTGTAKGPKYRMAAFGGFSITVDDVLKEGNTVTQRLAGSEAVSNLIRSYESGGAAIAGLDRARSDVDARESPALHSSIRVLSEIPIEGASTLDRMLVMPAIGEPWGRGNIFNVEISSRLTEPAAIEAMHRAYSAYVTWAFQRIESDSLDAYDKARAETESWGIDSRHAERYAAAVAGHFMFRDFCESVAGLDIAAQTAAAIDGLRDAARAQASASVPLAERFASDLRRAILRGRIAFPGPPVKRDTDGLIGDYGAPWVIGAHKEDHGSGEDPRIFPYNDLTYSDIGLVLLNGGILPIPNPRAIHCGFILPPRDDKKGGPKGHPITYGWHIACRTGQWEEICRIVSEISGRVYDPKSVAESLDTLTRGGVTREHIIPDKQAERVKIFDAIWALKSRED